MRLLLSVHMLLMAAAVHSQSNDEKALIQLNESFIHGYMTRDTASLRSIFADDFILVNPAGQRRNKREVLNGFITAPNFLYCNVDTVQVRLFGNIGLVNARAVFATESNGKQAIGKTDYLDVYQKRQGRWVAVAAHVTALGNR